MNDPRKPYMARLSALKSARQSWESGWKEVARFIDPDRGRFLVSDRNDGKRRDENIPWTFARQ
ncbi:MAG: hypothetical protein HQL54_03660 [Magnetococcales bacterium]|nr:hypothetical protein [Magnetococcales bacterium]